MNATVLKTVIPRDRNRGFESHPLLQAFYPIKITNFSGDPEIFIQNDARLPGEAMGEDGAGQFLK